MLIPTVISKTDNGQAAFDIFSRLLKDRIIFCEGEINESLASVINAQLLFLNSENKELPIAVFICSPGGSIDAGLSIINIMQYITCPVSTIVNGYAASMGSVIAAAGQKGMRYIMPNSRIMLHTASSSMSGNILDTKVNFEQLELRNKVCMEKLSEFSGQKITKIISDCQRDFWLSDKDAVKYGLVDEILTKEKK